MSQTVQPVHPEGASPYHSGVDQQHHMDGQQEQILVPQPQFRRLTPEEMRAFRECNRESFYYRSLPFATIGCFGVAYLTRVGYLKPSPFYGNYLKYTGAIILGYFVGKFSYLGKCREKLMALPNSPLADALKKNYGGGKRQLEVFQEMVSLPEITTGGGSSNEGYAPMQGSDMYTSPDFSVSGGAKGQQESQPAQKPAATYDELRRRNREEYLKQQFGITPSTPGQQQPSPPQSQQPMREEPQPSKFSYAGPEQQSAGKRGKYGDQDFS